MVTTSPVALSIVSSNVGSRFHILLLNNVPHYGFTFKRINLVFLWSSASIFQFVTPFSGKCVSRKVSTGTSWRCSLQISILSASISCICRAAFNAELRDVTVEFLLKSLELDKSQFDLRELFCWLWYYVLELLLTKLILFFLSN